MAHLSDQLRYFINKKISEDSNWGGVEVVLQDTKSPERGSTRSWNTSAYRGLLRAMAARDHRLTPEERKRNAWGLSMKFSFNAGEPSVYLSSLPGFFLHFYRRPCKMELFDLPTFDGLPFIPRLCGSMFLGTEALAGIPSLKALPHTALLGYHGVNDHDAERRNKSIGVDIRNRAKERSWVGRSCRRA